MSTRRGWRASTSSVRITLQRVRERVEVKSPVRENCTLGSVRGAPGNRRPYRDHGAKLKITKFTVALFVAYLSCVRLCADDIAASLPDGVKVVWDVNKAYHETGPTRERICLNGLWR